MFVFCKLDHHGTQFGIALFCFHLMHVKGTDPKKYSVGPWGPMDSGWEELV